MTPLSLFSLQKLENSILAIPIVELLRHDFDLSVFLMNNGSYDLYADLFPKLSLVGFDGNWDILNNRFPETDIAIGLCPNGNREVWALWRTPARRKILFDDRGGFLAKIFSGEKIHWGNLHDLDNNLKLLGALRMDERYPDLGYLIPYEKNDAVCLYPTASTQFSYYPKQFWLAVIHFLDQQGYKLLMLSGNRISEELFCRKLIESAKTKNAIEYRKEERISEAAGLILGSRLFVGSDSPLTHLAALLDVFTVALWSSADYRRIYPYGNNAHVYIPMETVQAKSFGPSSKIFHQIQRANAADIIEILKSLRKESFTTQPKFKKPVKFYIY